MVDMAAQDFEDVPSVILTDPHRRSLHYRSSHLKSILFLRDQYYELGSPG